MSLITYLAKKESQNKGKYKNWYSSGCTEECPDMTLVDVHDKKISGIFADNIAGICIYNMKFAVKCTSQLEGMLKLRKLIYDQISIDINSLHWMSYGTDEDSAIHMLEDVGEMLQDKDEIVEGVDEISEPDTYWYYDVEKEQLYAMHHYYVETMREVVQLYRNKRLENTLFAKFEDPYVGYDVFIGTPYDKAPVNNSANEDKELEEAINALYDYIFNDPHDY